MRTEINNNGQEPLVKLINYASHYVRIVSRENLCAQAHARAGTGTVTGTGTGTGTGAGVRTRARALTPLARRGNTS